MTQADAAPEPAGRVILVTGASSGIGRATAHRLAERGDALVLVARGRRALEETADECRARGAASVLVQAADVTDGAALEAAVRAALDEHGHLDAAVQSAGVVAYGRFLDVPADVWERVVDVNLFGSANLARSVLPGMRKRGRGALVLLGSVLGDISVPQMSAYVVSKWAIRSLTRELQLENRDCPGVAVTNVTPGSVDTPIYLQAANYAGNIGRPPPPVISPEKAARAVVSAVDRPQRRSVDVGPANALMRTGYTLVPRVFDALVGPFFAVSALDRQPTEPGQGNLYAPDEQLNGLYGGQGSSVVATARVVGERLAGLVRRS